MKKQKVTFSGLMCGVCFALFFFAFMLTEAFINERCAVILGSDAVNTVYAFGLVCTGSGFLCLRCFVKFVKRKKEERQYCSASVCCVLWQLLFY